MQFTFSRSHFPEVLLIKTIHRAVYSRPARINTVLCVCNNYITQYVLLANKKHFNSFVVIEVQPEGL